MVQKTADVLFFFGPPPGARLTEIAAALAFPKTTCYDILKALLANDFVHYADGKHKFYAIGAQNYAIGMVYLDSSRLLPIARPYVTLLAGKYKKTAFIATRHNDRVTYIYKSVPLTANAPTSNIGDQKMLHCTAIGKCYLAFDADAAKLVGTIDLVAQTDYTITDRAMLRANLREIRALGYSYERRESHEKMACLAAPIYHHGAMTATLSMTGFYRNTEDFTHQGHELIQFADLISGQLDADEDDSIS